MKDFIRKSVVLFLAFLFIMTTGGFSIYHHFCRCEGEVTESIFLEADCDHQCDVVLETHACCASEAKESCCSGLEADKQKAGNHHSDDCCNSSSSFFKIQDNFRVSIEKISLKFIAGLVKVLTGIDFIAQPTAQAVVLPEVKDTSPPLYGTELLHSIHQLKIAHFQV